MNYKEPSVVYTQRVANRDSEKCKYTHAQSSTFTTSKGGNSPRIQQWMPGSTQWSISTQWNVIQP